MNDISSNYFCCIFRLIDYNLFQDFIPLVRVCRWFLIEEKCRYLSNFSLQTAEVELPGEFLLPKVRTTLRTYHLELKSLLSKPTLDDKVCL